MLAGAFATHHILSANKHGRFVVFKERNRHRELKHDRINYDANGANHR